MTARRLKHCECTADVRAEIRFRLLDRRNDVRARRKMKDSLRARASRIDRSLVGNIGFDDFQPRVPVMLPKICAPADDKAIEDADAPAFVDQTINEMTADETCAASDQIQNFLADFPLFGLPTRPA